MLIRLIVEPAQAQLAANRIVYILLSLITKGVFEDNEALLDFVYELIELTGEQGMGFSLGCRPVANKFYRTKCRELANWDTLPLGRACT